MQRPERKLEELWFAKFLSRAMLDILKFMDETGNSELLQDPVEIFFKIEKDHEGYPKSQDWEDLWCSPVAGGGFRVDSSPFFVKEIASGDIVSAVRTEEGWYKFEAVISRGGNSNFRIWLRDGMAEDRDKIVQALRELGCHVEVTLERLIAIDVPADRETEVWDYLEAGHARDTWELQVGFSPDSQS
jgi:hypothetical protein